MLHKYAKAVVITVLAISSAAVVHAQSVVSTITLPGLPEQVAVNALTDRVYVAVPNFGAEPFDYLTVINGKSETVIKNIEIPPIAYAVAVDPLRGLVYVGGSYVDADGNTHNEVVAVNSLTDRVLRTISVSTTAGNGIQGLAVNALNGDLYVTNASDNEVDVIDCFEVKDRISTSGEPYGVTVNPLLNTIYVALINGNVSVINGKTNEITTTTPVGISDAGIAVDITTGNVFATNSVGFPDAGSVGVLDKTGDLLSTVPAGNFPLGIDVDLGTHLVFVANSGDNTISVINGKTDAVNSTLPVSALFLAVNPVTKRVYVAPATNTAALTVLSEN
jgi:YVTN family beta-propeller protein